MFWEVFLMHSIKIGQICLCNRAFILGCCVWVIHTLMLVTYEDGLNFHMLLIFQPILIKFGMWVWKWICMTVCAGFVPSEGGGCTHPPSFFWSWPINQKVSWSVVQNLINLYNFLPSFFSKFNSRKW